MTAIVEADHQQAVVERLEDVLVEGAQPIELGGLEVQLAVQPAVLDRGRGLSGHRRQQRHVFAGQRLAAVAAAERQHGDGGVVRDARHEVVDAGVAPELDFLGGEPAGGERIVEAHRVAGRQPRGKLPIPAQSGGGAVLEPVVAERARTRRGSVAEHQRHAVDDERLLDARHEAIGEPRRDRDRR